MSKKFIADTLKEATGLTGIAATQAAGALIEGMTRELKKEGRFTIPNFGALIVRKTKARKGVNPKTGEAISIKSGKTVRFKPAKKLRKSV